MPQPSLGPPPVSGVAVESTDPAWLPPGGVFIAFPLVSVLCAEEPSPLRRFEKLPLGVGWVKP